MSERKQLAIGVQLAIDLLMDEAQREMDDSDRESDAGNDDLSAMSKSLTTSYVLAAMHLEREIKKIK